MDKSWLKKILSQTGSQLISRVFIIIITLLVTIILRRFGGVSNYGLYLYIANIAILVVSLLDVGTHLTGVREMTIRGNFANYILGDLIAIRIVLLLSVFVILPSLASLNLLPEILIQYLPFALLLGTALLWKETLVVVYHGLEKLEKMSLLSSVYSLVPLFASLVFVFQSQIDIKIFLSLLIFLLFLLNFIFSISLIKNKIVTFHWNRAKILKLLLDSLPLGATLLLFSVYSKLDTVLIEHFYSVKEVGIYGLAYKIYENLILPAAFLCNALLPSFSRWVETDKKLLNKMVLRVLSVILLVSISGCLLTYLIRPWIFQILTGEMTNPELSPFVILLWAIPIAYVNHLLGYLIIALKIQKWSIVWALLGLVVNLIGNIYFLPIYGITAAAWMTVVTELVVCLGTGSVIIRKLRKPML